jgi:hypothetical protein
VQVLCRKTQMESFDELEREDKQRASRAAK